MTEQVGQARPQYSLVMLISIRDVPLMSDWSSVGFISKSDRNGLPNNTIALPGCSTRNNRNKCNNSRAPVKPEGYWFR